MQKVHSTSKSNLKSAFCVWDLLCKKSWVLFVCSWLSLSVFAQSIPPDDDSPIENPVNNDNGLFLGDSMDEQRLEDSLAKAKKVIAINTEWLNLDDMMDGKSGRSKADFRLDDLIYPDLIDRQDGFSFTLGQWGKPYQRWRYGANASVFEQGNSRNLVTGEENVYFLDPIKGMRYFDTHTPYVNASYAQGKADAAELRVDVSQNINPLLNVGLLYFRRKSNGVYPNFVTDDNTLGASSNFHTLNNRYRVFAHYLFQLHNDNINGGVVPLEPDSSLFNQGSQPVALEGANLRRLSRAGAMRQFYRITKDTVDAKHSLWVYNGASADFFFNQFGDGGIDPSVNQSTFLVYPTLGDTFFYERMITRRVQVDAGLTYQLNGSRIKSRQRLEIAQAQIGFDKNELITKQSRTSAMWKGNLLIDPNPFAFEGNWTYKQTVSNLFKPETLIDLEAELRIPKWKFDYSYRLPGPGLRPEDSVTVTKTHRPIAITLHSMLFDRNPSLQQSYGIPWSGNNFTPNANFTNQRTEHIRLGFKWSGKSKWLDNSETQGRFIQLSAFNTRNFGQIYLGDATGFVQAAPRQYLQYTGLELKLRANLGHFYLETMAVGQNFTSNNGALDSLFSEMQPRAYTKTSVFYENRKVKFARAIRIGFDCWYSLDFKSPAFDPASQAFYPQLTYVQKGYPRLDAYFSAHIKRAFIFLRVLNTMEGVTTLGYFSTTAYPMAPRQVMLGLNWTFFD